MKVRMDRMLASAVILSWEDLPHAFATGLVHIEYAPGIVLDYVKLWQLVAKGDWSLICEYWMFPRPAAALTQLTFSNGYHSEGLGRMLAVIMQHQADFAHSEGPGAGMVQVIQPTEEEKQAASVCMRQAYDHLRLSLDQIAAA